MSQIRQGLIDPAELRDARVLARPVLAGGGATERDGVLRARQPGWRAGSSASCWSCSPGMAWTVFVPMVEAIAKVVAYRYRALCRAVPAPETTVPADASPLRLRGLAGWRWIPMVWSMTLLLGFSTFPLQNYLSAYTTCPTVWTKKPW
jgi:hypothetical protein